MQTPTLPLGSGGVLLIDAVEVRSSSHSPPRSQHKLPSLGGVCSRSVSPFLISRLIILIL